jgi:hypothetical protein
MLYLAERTQSAFYKQNIESIKSEKVERYKTKEDSMANGKIYSSIKMSMHSCFSNFHFIIDKTVLKKGFDQFDLSNEKKSPNINYKYNRDLKLVTLANICEKAIKKIR